MLLKIGTKIRMRFIENGPSIPDDLLHARDQGRVVFFCGAGVSRAKANLPDFFGLAEAVTTSLGVNDDNPVRKLLNEAREIDVRVGESGLISADRIFGLLERSFETSLVESEVASALKPAKDPDLSAHRTLLDLATTRERFVRLVTTNFDRLFDGCRKDIQTFQPPRLPDPSRAADFNGVVYLHGRASPDYAAAEGDGFVLSSTEFGRAYLSEGWATAFFREIIAKYVVVFVGYGASDPPVQYLLEALNKTAGQLDGVYAFQSGDPSEAQSKWRHKGVEAIAYQATDKEHSVLWNSLELWANRARDPDQWVASVVEKAKQGPANLSPIERGQFAHVITTVEGVKALSDADEPPPATWLCAFDPLCRFAKPGRHGPLFKSGPFVDPFDFYGLDSDPVPDKIKPDDFYTERPVPDGAWNAFALNDLDRSNLRDENYSSFRGYGAAVAPILPPRLRQMGVWFRKVANQPAALWWATRQRSLHPEILNQISWELEQNGSTIEPIIKKAWRYLIDYWNEYRGDPNHNLFEMTAEIKTNGWSSYLVRRFAAAVRPYLKIDPGYHSDPLPPESTDGLSSYDLIRTNVEYPDTLDEIEFQDDWLERIVVQLRKNLEVASELETETGGYSLTSFGPIIPEDDESISVHSRNHGLTAAVINFSLLFERFLKLNPDAAKAEFAHWNLSDGWIFTRLGIWGAGKPELVSSEDFGPLIERVPNESFWYSYHARDLLVTLQSRWNTLPAQTRESIEKRLLRGRDRWDNEEEKDFAERRASLTLSFIHSMNGSGCEFSFDIGKVTERLSKQAPKWKPKYASEAARSLEPRGGWVRTVTEYSALRREPVPTILEKAKELSGHDMGELVKRDPFAGLSADYPVRALAALRMASEKGDFPKWAWRTFLYSEKRKSDKPKFNALIAKRILTFAETSIANFIRSAASWCRATAGILAEYDPELYSRLIDKLVGVLALNTNQTASAVVRGSREPDWAMEAINSPTGDIATAVIHDLQTIELTAEEGFPKKSGLNQVELLLGLPDDLRRHALVIFARQLSWFYAIDPEWTQKNLLSILYDDDKADRQAFWSGFLGNARINGDELFTQLKPHLLSLAKSGSLEKRGQTAAVSALLLSAWILIDTKAGDRWVTNEELRNAILNSTDEFRTNFLWQTERWSTDAHDGDPRLSISNVVELIRDVWPKQKVAKSPAISGRLCELTFSSEKLFSALAEIILPLLSKIDSKHMSIYKLRKSERNIVEAHPIKTLAVLHTVLADKVELWPYGIGDILDRIGAADTSLKNDERLVELRRIWNAR